MFSGYTNDVSVIDEGLPGSLPVLNIGNLHMLTILASVFKVGLNPWLTFTRKSYFYVDLPLGYQISQRFHPMINTTKIPMISSKVNKTCNLEVALIRDICLEHDSGNIIGNKDHVGFCRSGRSLIELTTYPCFDRILDIKLFILKLRFVLIHVGVSVCDMSNSGLRFDINVSSMIPFVTPSTKTEFKNISGLATLNKILSYEIITISLGRRLYSETKYWNKCGITFSRIKEWNHGYKHFLDPDLTSTRLWSLNIGTTLLCFGMSRWLVLLGSGSSVSKDVLRSDLILTKTGLILLSTMIKSIYFYPHVIS
ncbi:Aspartyl/glutamyl-tRNA(Asn/Gln) amidotransferase subunit B [Candidatus Hodgkinia cicadicola]|uniref:Aspartyl/glutamyl-tRNA(Asn/Gln) amidotransferase subunit B n=1 Tax=Candidatus Hodgkinia cicadicola TaxID=573658 RepID=A0ABX4MGR9_9HYPH|nr:Aspartyl/glutamyl-tRNA(Asn/Gln) amidotransferase subunit B [Candidatus Hodgkinia cicadicola]